MIFARIMCVAMLIGGFITLNSFAGENHEMPPLYEGSTELKRIKGLAGTWAGQHIMGEETKDVTIEYYVTSNGSAVVEKYFPGTPHEMVSIYHDKGNKVSMTHYCALGNQPQMDLIGADLKSIQFSLSAQNDIDVATEDHMHALTILFDDAGKITHQWKLFQNGVEAAVTTLKLSKIK